MIARIMSNATLPNQLDVRKLAVKGVEISAEVPISSLPRVIDLLASDNGLITVKLDFYIDEQRFKRIDGQLKSRVEVFCQRCLEPMWVEKDADFNLAIVWSEKDAERLPKSLDPLIVGEELTEMYDVVSEELILSLPFVNYHSAEECGQVQGYISADPDAIVDAVEEPKENPFNILAQLKQN